ncbi:MAG: hypothetical protein HZA54_01760 [Planctomycetes bacterium]|nr:hypothetical protein [Planctomycetota bacterium]
MRGPCCCEVAALLLFFAALVLGRSRWLFWRMLLPGRNPWRTPWGGGWGRRVPFLGRPGCRHRRRRFLW